jgi:hypothetical protein
LLNLRSPRALKFVATTPFVPFSTATGQYTQNLSPEPL